MARAPQKRTCHREMAVAVLLTQAFFGPSIAVRSDWAPSSSPKPPCPEGDCDLM